MSTWKVQAKYFDPETREWQEDTFIESGYVCQTCNMKNG